MVNHLKKMLSNEKGFTLVEILVVISIIAILFVTLLPQIDFAGDKARQTGVKTDFHTLQIAAESYLRESAGETLTASSFDSYLDTGMQTKADGNATGTGLDSTKEDPWGVNYDVFIYDDSTAGERAIVIKSFGKDETNNTDDDFILSAYYHQGQVGSCTDGFETNNVKTDIIAANPCGEKVGGGAFTSTPK